MTRMKRTDDDKHEADDLDPGELHPLLAKVVIDAVVNDQLNHLHEDIQQNDEGHLGVCAHPHGDGTACVDESTVHRSQFLHNTLRKVVVERNADHKDQAEEEQCVCQVG